MLYYAQTIVKPENRILELPGKEAAHALVRLVEPGVRIAVRLRPDPDFPVDVPLPGGILHSQRSAGRHQHRARPGPGAGLLRPLLDFFHSPALDLDKLPRAWCALLFRLGPGILRVNGRPVLVGDGIKVAK